MPYLWLDAMYVKVREGGRVVSRAVLIAIGVNEEGEREVLCVSIAQAEVDSITGSVRAVSGPPGPPAR